MEFTIYAMINSPVLSYLNYTEILFNNLIVKLIPTPQFQMAICLLVRSDVNLLPIEQMNGATCFIAILFLLFNWEVTVLMSLSAVNYYYFLLQIFF